MWGVGIQKTLVNEKCEMEVQLFGKTEQLNKSRSTVNDFNISLKES